jgi:P-type E1-E2 ATPase
LAIGDGANDCNMIQEAIIGVGVFGDEGRMTLQICDYAVEEFYILTKLVLVHGRQNYIRITEMINYFFYKNFVMTKS